MGTPSGHMSLSHAPTSRDARVCPPPTARWRLAIKGPNVNVRQVRYAASEAGAADIGSRVLRARARLQTSERATRPPPRRRIRGLSGPTGMRVAPAYGLRSHRTWQRECASLCTVTIGRYRHPVTCPTSRLPPRVQSVNASSCESGVHCSSAISCGLSTFELSKTAASPAATPTPKHEPKKTRDTNRYDWSSVPKLMIDTAWAALHLCIWMRDYSPCGTSDNVDASAYV